MDYIIHNAMGAILRTVDCPPTVALMQVGFGEFIIEGKANDATQKVVDGKVVDKTQEEIDVDNPPPQIILDEDRCAYISKKQWQAVLDRLSALESKNEQ